MVEPGLNCEVTTEVEEPTYTSLAYELDVLMGGGG